MVADLTQKSLPVSDSDPTVPCLDAGWPGALSPPRAALADALLAYVRPRRWFRAKARVIRGARVADVVMLEQGQAALAILEIAYAHADAERYLIPLAVVASGAPASALVARLPVGVLVDGLATGQLAPALFAFMRDGAAARGEAGELRGEAEPGLREIAGAGPMAARASAAEQSNSSVALGERVLLKTYRQLGGGFNPERELGRLLARHPRRPPTPRLLGSLQYRDAGGADASVAVAHELWPNDGDGWEVTLRQLRRPTPQPAGALAGFAARAETLGRRTGEVHLALFDAAAAGVTDPALLPEPLTDADRAGSAAAAQAAWAALARRLPERLPSLPPSLRAVVSRLLAPGSDERRRLDDIAADFRDRPLPVVKTRIHGDLHLGQVLCRGDDFAIIDFEGEPARALGERRTKASPLRDVVGMLRSFDYAAAALLRDGDAPPAAPGFVDSWKRAVADGYLRGYRACVATAPFLPPHPDQLALMLRFFALERVLYEIGYELDNRPDWIDIPLGGLCALAAPPSRDEAAP